MDRYSCNLWDFLKDSVKYTASISERLDLLIEIIQVVIFIHGKGYAHRDIKPSNIFVQTVALQNNKRGLLNGHWALADFGLSSKFSLGKLARCGTAGFASMEQFDGKLHKKSDNYAIAKTAILILFPWNLAWKFLALPISNADYQNFPWKKHHMFQIITKLVDVSNNLGQYQENND